MNDHSEQRPAVPKGGENEGSEKASVPDREVVRPGAGSIEIHEVLQVVHRRHLIPLGVMGAVAVLALGYLLLGRIPVSVEGNAMFLTPGTVVPFQSTASGQIGRWHVRVGDRVKKGQLLVELDQPLTKKQLEQARQQLADIETRNDTLEAQSEVYVQLERGAFERKKKTLRSRIDTLADQIKASKQATLRIHRRKTAFLAQREKDLKEIRTLNRQRNREMREQLELAGQLGKKGLRSEDEILDVKRQQIAQEDRSSSLDLQVVQVTLDKARAAELLLDAENRITEQEQQMADLEHQMHELVSREAELSEQAKSANYGRQIEASDLKRKIVRLEEQLTEEREVRSKYNGLVIELTHSQGERVAKGATLGSIDTRGESDELKAVAYFRHQDGKKIEPGMTIRLTPAIVEHDRFGGLLGKVLSVSEYPVTTEGVARTIGNTQAANTLTKDSHRVEVYAELIRDKDTFSGFAWERFGGPSMRVTAGTIGRARANIKEVRPIAFVLPILQDI